MTIQVGTRCPAFSVPSTLGTRFDTKDFVGKQPFVLFFYPKADTPGCTLEACGFSDAISRYNTLGVPVFGISPDPIAAVTAFAEKFNLKFPLLADGDHAVCEQFGMWVEKKMMGKPYMGAARTTFIVGKDGTVAHVFENVDPKSQHDQQVLAWIAQNLT